jgi:trigger factor
VAPASAVGLHNKVMSMQVNETSSEGLKRELTVIVPAADIETKLADRLAEIGQSITIPGFRPGKVPMPLLRQRYGEAVRHEILERTIQDKTQEALTDKGLRAALEPTVEIVKFEEGSDLEYKVAIEVLPEIEPFDFSSISLNRYVVTASEEGLAEALKRISEQHKRFDEAAADHAAEEGDRVTIDFVGSVDGETFEGGTAEDFPLELGDKRFVAGFDEQLVGAKAGEQREITVTFPEDYPHDALKGKTAVFATTIKKVETPVIPEIDEEFAKTMGLESVDDLKNAVREQLERDYASVSRSRIKRDLLDKLSEVQHFELPAGMVEREFESIWHQVEHAKEHGELDEDDQGVSEEELKERYRKIAERRVRLGLLLSDVGRRNNLTVTQDDLSRAIGDQARRFPGQEQQVLEFYQRNPAATQELQAPIFEDKVVDFVLEMANVSEKTVELDELLRLESEVGEADHAH